MGKRKGPRRKPPMSREQAEAMAKDQQAYDGRIKGGRLVEG